MSGTRDTEFPEARAVEDAAWNVKDCAADLFGRALSDTDKAVLASVQRDLDRLLERLVEIRDRRRRRRNGAAADAQPALDLATEAEPSA